METIIDDTDIAILAILQKDHGLTNASVGQRVGLDLVSAGREIAYSAHTEIMLLGTVLDAGKLL